MNRLRRWEMIWKKKGPGKDQCVILVLLGVLLCVIALPVKSDKKSGLSDKQNDMISKQAKVETTDAGVQEQKSQTDYAGYWEKKLEETLSCIEGAGKIRVMITLQQSEEKIVEKDGPQESTDTQESDSGGGTRTIREQQTDLTTVYTEDGEGNSVPFVIRTKAPVVEGIVVIAEGGGNASVKEEIIASVQVLFHLDANKIRVVKMKNINQ